LLEREVEMGVREVANLSESISENEAKIKAVQKSIEIVTRQRERIPFQAKTIEELKGRAGLARQVQSELAREWQELVDEERREFLEMREKLAERDARNRALGRELLALQTRQHKEVSRLRAILARDDAVRMSSESILDASEEGTDSTSVRSGESVNRGIPLPDFQTERLEF
jgi:hypothetical protein